MIDPRALIVTGRFRYDRVALPAAHRISPPSGLVGIVGKLAAVGPDGTDAVTPHVMLIDPVREHDKFARVRIDQRARHAHGIAVLIGVGSIRRRDGSAPAD